MKNLILIVFGLLFSMALFGQTKQQIIDDKITSKTIFEQRLDKGINNKYVIEELKYDSEGRLIELKEISRKGEIKLWIKYSFNASGNIIEEITLDMRGKVEKREITHYVGNLRAYKEYFDSKGRMYKKKSYEYTFGK